MRSTVIRPDHIASGKTFPLLMRGGVFLCSILAGCPDRVGIFKGEHDVKRTVRSVMLVAGFMFAMAIAGLPVMQAGVVAQTTSTPAGSPVTGSSGIAAAAAGAADRAAGWLVSRQADDGSFAGFSGKADAGTTVDAILALVAARDAGVDVGSSIDDAVGYLASGDIALVYTQTGVGQAAKLALGLIATGQNPDDFAKVSPLLILEHGLNADTGFYGTGLYDTALTMLAFTATGKEIPASVFDVLASRQADNGGWAYDGTPDAANADSNTTSMVVQALVASGHGESELVAGGVMYLRATIVDGGGAFNVAPGAAADANSTALVAQGLLAIGEVVTPLLAALEDFQNADGSLYFNAETPGPNLLATVQAIPALAKVVFPIVPEAIDVATPVAIFPHAA